MSKRYEITRYTYGKAQQYNFKLAPSKDPAKKIDVLDKNGNHIISVGDISKDYFCDIYETDPKKALHQRIIWQKQNLKQIREIDEKNQRSEEYYINLLLN